MNAWHFIALSVILTSLAACDRKALAEQMAAEQSAAKARADASAAESRAATRQMLDLTNPHDGTSSELEALRKRCSEIRSGRDTLNSQLGELTRELWETQDPAKRGKLLELIEPMRVRTKELDAELAALDKTMDSLRQSGQDPRR